MQTHLAKQPARKSVAEIELALGDTSPSTESSRLGAAIISGISFVLALAVAVVLLVEWNELKMIMFIFTIVGGAICLLTCLVASIVMLCGPTLGTVGVTFGADKLFLKHGTRVDFLTSRFEVIEVPLSDLAAIWFETSWSLRAKDSTIAINDGVRPTLLFSRLSPLTSVP